MASIGAVELLTRISSEMKEGQTGANACRRLFVQMSGAADVSAQQCIHHIFGWPLYHATRTFQWLNTNESFNIDLKAKEGTEHRQKQ